MNPELIAAIGGICVATISGIFAWLTSKTRKENETAHTTNHSLLSTIDKRTEQIDGKLDLTTERLAEHEGWHKGRGDYH